MRRSHFFLGLPFAAALLFSQVGPVSAQTLPDPVGQEALIKISLLSFNDANVTANYDVFHAKLAKPFRDQFSAEKLKTIFKSFVDQHIDFDFIVVKQPIPDEPAAIDDKGTLKLYGHFDTKPNWVKYKLDFIRSEGEWKIIGIDVNLSAPPEPAAVKSDSGKVKVN